MYVCVCVIGPVGLEKALKTGGRKAEALPIKSALVVTKTTRYQVCGSLCVCMCVCVYVSNVL